MWKPMTMTMLSSTPKRGQQRRLRWQDVSGVVYVLPWLLTFLCFQAGPILFSFFLTFTEWDLAHPIQWVGLRNYAYLITEYELLRVSMINTFIYALFAVPGGLVVAFALASLLNLRVYGLSFYRTLFYLPSVASGVATAVVWIWILQPNGLLNSFLGIFGIEGPRWLASTFWAKPALILMSWWSVGGTMIIFLAGLQGIPQSLYDAAEVDGANSWAKLLHVTLPLMTPYIFLNLVLGIIGALQVFTQALVMTDGGPADATLFVLLLMYRIGWNYFRMGEAATIAWLLLVIILALTLLQFAMARRWVYYEAGGKE
jgi:multiple sugar transport system permease protein